MKEKLITFAPQIDWADFPELGSLHFPRSLSLGDTNPSDIASEASSAAKGTTDVAASSVSQASDAAQGEISQVSNSLQRVSDDIRSHLPAFYSVGLRSFCQGESEESFSECSKPSNSFAFDLLSIFGTISNKFDALLPRSAKETLAGYRQASQFAISGYIVGITTIVISLALCFTSVVLEWRGRFHLWTGWKYGDIAAFVLSAVCSKICRAMNFMLILIAGMDFYYWCFNGGHGALLCH